MKCLKKIKKSKIINPNQLVFLIPLNNKTFGTFSTFFALFGLYGSDDVSGNETKSNSILTNNSRIVQMLETI